MQKRSIAHSGFFGQRSFIGLFLCAAAISSALAGILPARAGKLASGRPEAPANVSSRTLSVEERVSYQRAIEEVYWRHRIWPKERPDPKPSLDGVMSQAQLEKKVADYLRNSQALEDYWQRPITGEQLQAEMDRMARHTKQPEVLRELFEALGNDPFVIAECLARPALAQRLLTNWHAYDQRIHGELKQRAEADLRMHPTVKGMKQTSGKYSEIELVKGDRNEHNRGSNPGLELSPHEWNETLCKLAAMFGKSKNNTRQPQSVHSSGDSLTPEMEAELLSPLQEDNGRYYAIAVLDKTKDRLKLATIEWTKEPVESWRARAENQVTQVTAAGAVSYTLPKISDDACTDDTWTATLVNGPSGRETHTAVWTGSEMIIWGGGSTGSELNTGGRYNPSTDTWTATSTANAPSPRYAHTAIWTVVK
jgi:hypothetical protein